LKLKLLKAILFSKFVLDFRNTCRISFIHTQKGSIYKEMRLLAYWKQKVS